MSQKRVSAFLWRRANQATIDTLIGKSVGQYDIRLGATPEVENFLHGLPREEATDLGGFSIRVPVEAYEAEVGGVPAQTVSIRYMGPNSSRRDWYIRAQRPTTAYPLWRKGRGLDQARKTSDQYTLLIRDVDGKYHARWISSDDYQALPLKLRTAFASEEIGVYDLGVDMTTSLAEHVTDLLKKHFNVLIYGPPGTGKTHLMQQVAALFNAQEYYVDTEKERQSVSDGAAEQTRIGWVTFHQSYSYEDFIVGLRPDPTSKAILSLQPSPGILLELAESARQQGQTSLLMIDEINRGNVSRIFGEFITLLEPEKRLKSDNTPSSNTVSVRLPYIKPGVDVQVPLLSGKFVSVPNPFTMPLRLYTLASMNSVDKTIAPLDSALRRRFYVLNLDPDLSEISHHMNVSYSQEIGRVLPRPIETADQVQILALDLLHQLNLGISFFLGPEYQLGQWYLGDLCQKFDSAEAATLVLLDTWTHKLLPQLEDLFQGRIEQLEAVLQLENTTDHANDPIAFVRPPTAMEELGAAPFLQRRDANSDQAVSFLARVAGVKWQVPETPAAA